MSRVVCVCVCFVEREGGEGWNGNRRFFVVVFLRNSTLFFFFWLLLLLWFPFIFLIVVCSSSKKESAVLGVVELWMRMAMRMAMVDIHMVDCEERGRV